MPDSLYAVFVALLVLLGSAMSLLGLRHWSDRRARTRIAASPISTLTTGEWLGSEVAVAGVLQPVPGSEPTIAPFSKQASLWFKHVVNFSSGAPRRGNTSEDRFLIVDDTGQLTIDPVGFRVFTTHRRVTLGGTLGTKRTKPQSEDRLMVGDTVYVHGLLQPDAARPDVPVLTIDRNELHTITNIPPAVLRRNAGRLLTISLLLCLGCAAIVVWSDSERRRPNVPGLLT